MSEPSTAPSLIPHPRYKSSPGDGESLIPLGTPVLESGEVFSPVMVLKQDALQNNLQSMSAFCRDHDVQLAMHGKTSMSPELTHAQLEAGAWGVSAATPSQVRTFRSFGVKNVILANELVDPAGIRWISDYQLNHPDEGFLCYVDSLRGVDLLENCLARVGGAVLDVLVEVSVPGGRTGLRDPDETVQVAEAARQAKHLRLVGVGGYEGALAGDRGDQAVDRVLKYCQHVVSIAQRLDEQKFFETERVVLSVGGGAFFDIVVDVLKNADLPFSETDIIIRSGSYISHDDGLYSRIAAFAQPGSGYPIEAALELWGRVLSRPEPTLAFVDFGRRDAPFDQGLPTPKKVRDIEGKNERPAAGFTITALNDQHAYLTVPADDPLQPGDWVGSGISHPCTAFDKWRHIPIVDSTYTAVASVTTYF